MTTLITLDVFSGRQNPTWVLSDKQDTQLRNRLDSLNAVTDRRPSGAFGGLGYRGFKISTHDPSHGTTTIGRVHEAIFDRGISTSNLIDNTEVEKFLLETMPDAERALIESHLSERLPEKSQFNAATAAVTCPKCVAADAPAYNPAPWNAPSTQPFNNCYNYANDHATNTFAQPGRAHGAMTTTMDCAHVQPAAVADGLAAAANFAAPLKNGAGWYVALVIWPGADYHWYRQDSGGCWSHKPGQTAARDVDNAGNKITDPRTCNRGPYTVFCSYMVTKRGLVIN
ncbi:MAG: hypothetical protein KDJ25_14785 [Rhodoblastus sp.]|nr:hypothetical protein [Rhodoblastus sp.]